MSGYSTYSNPVMLVESFAEKTLRIQVSTPEIPRILAIQTLGETAQRLRRMRVVTIALRLCNIT